MADKVWVKEISVSELAPLEGLQGLWKRFVLPAPENHGMIFLMGKINPGEVAGWHEHPDPEVFFVLRGRGEARWKTDNVEHHADLYPGVAFYKIGGIPHQMINTGTEPLLGIGFKVETA